MNNHNSQGEQDYDHCMSEYQGAGGISEQEACQSQVDPDLARSTAVWDPIRLTLRFYQRQELCARISGAKEVCFHSHLCLNVKWCGISSFQEKSKVESRNSSRAVTLHKKIHFLSFVYN